MKPSLAKILILSSVGAILLTLLTWLFVALIPEPPLDEIEKARSAIAKARDHNSVIYSAKIFREARSYYDSAMISWKTENDRFILFRDYEKVRMFASISEKKAVEAAKKTIEKSNDLRTALDRELTRLNSEVKGFEKVFLSIPLSQEIKKKHARGKLLLKEAEIAFEKGQYVNGNVKITEANEYITESYAFARQKLSEYFRNYSRWQEWARGTISQSRDSSTYAIIVEKIPGLCHLYYEGKKKYTFEAEFGKNWMGDKVSRGDDATPEGIYIVTKKLSNGSTKYHKALMINYPNQQDLEEFNLKLQRGQLPAGAKIGELIEIHGDGGKGGNWTEGCVALKNRDMDLLFDHVDSGTPVTIIGASISLDQYISTR